MAQDDNDCTRISATHASDVKRREDVINMHNALADTFLDMIMMEPTYRSAYDRIRLCQPNTIFRDVVQHFLETYGRSTAEDRHANRERMAADWQPSQGFETLIDHINSNIQYALFSFVAISDDDIVDIIVCVLTRCGLYPEEMKAWHNRDGTRGAETEKTWYIFQIVWAKNISTCDDSTSSTTAGQHGYEMNFNQVTDGTTDDASFDTPLTNFSAVHQHTQAAINSLSTQNQALQNQHQQQMTQMQQQMNSIQQLLCMAAARPMMPTMQAPTYQAPAYNNQRNNNNNNNGGGGRNGGGGGNGYNNGGNGYNSNRAPPNSVKRFENLNYFSHMVLMSPMTIIVNVAHNPNATRTNTCTAQNNHAKCRWSQAVRTCPQPQHQQQQWYQQQQQQHQ